MAYAALTKPTKIGSVKHAWHFMDAKDKALGRLATDIAQKLMGKSKADFVRNLDMGDYVVVVNAKEIKVTGKKEEQKKYYRHSGYPGGFRAETLRELRARRPEEIVTRAVKGMLPQNRLRDRMLKRLFVFANAEHPYNDKFKMKSEKLEIT